MKYLDGFRNPEAAAAITADIKEFAEKLPKDRIFRLMEVCGSHTMAIARYGIRDLLPENVSLLSGPGCPVCVTAAGYIDAALELARQGKIIASFGDLLNVPGSDGNLAAARSEGISIEVCYSPLAALDIARKNPGREVVFLAIGFETTIPTGTSLVLRAQQENLNNISILTAFKTVPPALEALVSDPELRIDGFLLPPHVSAIIGSDAYRPFTDKHHLPCIIAGFEPLDMLYGLEGLLKQLLENRGELENQYSRVVKPRGNLKAIDLINTYLEPCGPIWRGIGKIPGSGLELREKFAEYDAAKKFGIEISAGNPDSRCRCGEVLKGKILPEGCPLFGKACTPGSPVGPCMVSSEGSCAAYYKYSRSK